jgi:hypothetical protein
MTQWLKQSTAATVKMGPFVDSTDGNTEETGLTISQGDIKLSKNGGAFAQTNNATGATHDANGMYGVPLDTTDTATLGQLKVYIHESGALAVWQDFMVVPANVWDSLFGADALQVHAIEISNGLITAAAIATGAIDADALAADAGTEIAAAVWSADSTGYADTTFGGAIGDWAGTGESMLSALINIDTNVTTILATDLPAVKTVVDAVLVDTGTTIPGLIADLPTAGENADAIWDEAVDGSVTARQSLRLANSANAGKASGMETTNPLIRDLADTKNRIDATVDADGNRSAVTLDLA